MKLEVWLMFVAYVSLAASQSTGSNTNETEALQFLQDYEVEREKIEIDLVDKEYTFKTNITDEHEKIYNAKAIEKAKFDLEWSKKAAEFNDTGMSSDVRRQFHFIRDIGTAAQKDESKLQKLTELQSEMSTLYNTAKVCLQTTKDGCLDMEPGITRLMAESRDYEKLLAVWSGWHDATGRQMKDMYVQYVDLMNDAVRQAGFKDASDHWRSWYESPTFEEDVAQLMSQVLPLYEQLHAYVRRHLKQLYGADKFPASGHIPAHLLGDIWAQEWGNIASEVMPYKDRPLIDVTDQLIQQNYTAKTMFDTAEAFFVSLGFDKMVPTFWTKSVIEKPTDGRKVACHASAWDFYNRKDFAIKMCTDITHEDLMTIHHEMGHIQYYMQYKDQPVVYRDGANNGFHEAIGDVMALSVQTPEHLKKINLLTEFLDDKESDVNFLMSMALRKLAFLPFGYLTDLWRWAAFRGDVTPDNYTKYWWDLKCRYQGLSSPIPRSSSDFDPGAKYHVAADVPYIRYFVSFIIQFQFHKAACQAAGHTGPLHRCDIYNSRDAGDLFRGMMQLGASQPWPVAMKNMTGQDRMDAGALLEYFHPLMEFLRKQNGNDYGWDPQCPSPAPISDTPADTNDQREKCLENTRTGTVTDIPLAFTFLESYDKEAGDIKYRVKEAEYAYESNLTKENEDNFVKLEMEQAEFDLRKFKESLVYNVTAMPESMRRQFKFIREIGSAAQPDRAKLQRLKQVRVEMESIYGSAEVCTAWDRCLSLEPDLTRLMSDSRDYYELMAAWKGWRDVTGPKMKKKYEEYVQLYNSAVNASCFKDVGEHWRSWYESPTFEADVANLLGQVMPLYEQLHGFVRRRLKVVYGEKFFPKSGHIPAHILGNMWAQSWESIVDLLTPYKDKPTLDVTSEMVKQNYTPLKIFQTADSFFESLGLMKMVPKFWDKSILEKPNDGRDLVCHATAYDFYNKEDFRIKMCTDITQVDLVTAHHEMGHVEYYMQYMDQPIVFRDGANPGFHEATGDVMALSVQTPEHLNKIGLLDKVPTDRESDINFLMKIALEKVAFLPFGYLIDQWRWSVFRGDTPPEAYNSAWWDLRCRLQGIFPPVARSSSDFDPGAKFHVPGDTPYIRYFVSFIVQFQFHKALCEAAGQTGPLHRCDIYGSKEAGQKIGSMLRLGLSKPWPDAMEILTGQRKMDAGPLMEFFQPLLDFLRKENGNDFGWDPMCPNSEGSGPESEAKGGVACGHATNTTGNSTLFEAFEFLKSYDKTAGQVRNQVSEADFTLKTNITDHNQKALVDAQMAKANFDLEQLKLALNFNLTGMPDIVQRQFKFIKAIGPSAEPNQKKVQRLKEVQNDMETIYNTGKVCLKGSQCVPLDPDISRLMATSSDYEKLLEAWKGWRDATGAKMKNKYAEYVSLLNDAVRASCYQDAGDYWRSWYESATFEQDVAELFAQIKPLYEQLHAHVRRHLKKKYGADKFPSTGHIPAHLLGNMWGQSWNYLLDLVLPYPGKPTLDVTAELKKQNYTVEKMFLTSEEFFTSLGLLPMVPQFWNKTMMVRPADGRDVMCQGYAQDFFNQQDFRIKMCTQINHEDLMTIHHEMGHVEYYMQYKDQPVIFREGANPGFHEAIGDAMTLSVQTPEHLHQIGLLAKVPNDTETDINFLMTIALQKIAFLPFGYLIDQWRWSVFRGDTKPDQYNKHWWDLRCRLQGLSSPVERSESDFDPGAKYHVPADVAYIRYFVSFVIQFQFHKAMCDAAGHRGPLHRCDIYNSKAAGTLFSSMMKLGQSKPWPDAMEVMTGQRKMDAGALLEYFRPLHEYLQQENGNDFGWDPQCPDFKTPRGHNSANSLRISTISLVVILILQVIVTLR
ncbi:angiotensin-converting enzyme-like [Physella acuta]|uniref:angiotensin-converting enzyme-like n=1 Tax=Physella acuta TaxID=109671 RepID=UPI0027DCC544|nr:angiotensin-converting enzyme-like [Physella acuta]